MDSVSQLVLGASLAHVTLGERLGRKALYVGAALGTLPDLDVLVPYADAVESFTYHRGWSHSLIVLSVASLPIAYGLKRLFASYDLSYKHWLFAVWLVLFTHPLLDAFTTYGTQLFWPFSPPPAAWGSVFIIDPLFTVPLIIGLIIAWRNPFARSQRIVSATLALSCTYLAWTLIAQHNVHQKLQDTLAQNGIDATQTLVAPFPLSLVWRTVAVTDEHYYEGFSSLLDSADTIRLSKYDNGKKPCSALLDLWPVERLDWFTRGVFALSVEQGELIASDLRIGIEGSYIFRFAIAQQADNDWQLIESRQLPVSVDGTRMSMLIKRAVDESVELTQLASKRVSCEPVPAKTQT